MKKGRAIARILVRSDIAARTYPSCHAEVCKQLLGFWQRLAGMRTLANGI